MTKASDDEVAARLNARDRRIALTGFPLLAMMMLVLAGLIFNGHAALLQNQTVQIVISLAFVAGVLLVFLPLARDRDPATDAAGADPAIMRKRIDHYHRYWRWTILFLLLASTNVVGEFVWAVSKATIPAPYVLINGASVVFTILIFAWTTANGPGGFRGGLHHILNDEFVCTLRARMMRLGYAAMMAAGAAALLTGMWRPDLAVPALAWALYAGFAIPALYYVIADWRASRDR